MKAFAPWTVEETHNIIRWQRAGYVHEFTCKYTHSGSRTLLVYTSGLVCPICDYHQNWVPDYVAKNGPGPNPIEALKKNA